MSAVILSKPHQDVQIGSYGFVITPEYLEQSGFSPINYQSLLTNAAYAKLLGLLYIEF